MPTNTLPSGIGDLFNLATRVAEGLGIYGRWLLREVVTAEEFDALFEEARETESIFALARARQAKAGKRFATGDRKLTSWLAKARLVVMLAYGNKWSDSWIAAGFTHRGTNVPKRIGARIELSRRLVGFLASHRQYEVSFAGVTAASAKELQREIVSAQKEVRLAKLAASAKKRARDSAEKKLRREIHHLVIFLSLLLGKSDPRWLAFGLNQPRPDAPPRVPLVMPGASQPIAVSFRLPEAGGRSSEPADVVA